MCLSFVVACGAESGVDDFFLVEERGGSLRWEIMLWLGLEVFEVIVVLTWLAFGKTRDEH